MELRAQREAGARQEEPHEHRNQDFPKGTRSLWDPHRAECCRGRRDVTNPWALNLVPEKSTQERSGITDFPALGVELL